MERRRRREKAGAFLSHIPLTSDEIVTPPPAVPHSVISSELAHAASDSAIHTTHPPSSTARRLISDPEQRHDQTRESMPEMPHVVRVGMEGTLEDAEAASLVSPSEQGLLLASEEEVDIEQPRKQLHLYRHPERVTVAPSMLPGWIRRRSVESHMVSDRVCLAVGGHVFAVFSVLGHNSLSIVPEEKSVVPDSPILAASVSQPLFTADIAGFSAPSRGQERSYGYLLTGTLDPSTEQDASTALAELDPPDMRKTKTVMNLPSWLVSVMPYANAQALKGELNEQFRLVHPWIDPSLSFSKIRACKWDMIVVALKTKAELSTAALAQVYFERLVRKNAVTKQNRKLLAAVSLLLASKFNDPVCSRASVVKSFLAAACRVFEAEPQDVLKAEFSTFVQLDFTLHVPKIEVFTHFTRILQSLDLPTQSFHEDTDLVSFHLQGAQQIAFAGDYV